MVNSQLRVMIMAGGTGGHIFPALAVATYLREEGVDVTWIGTQRGLESRLVPQAGFPIEYIKVSGLRGNGILGWVFAPVKLSLAIVQAIKIFMKVKPDSVLGMGGFASGPGGLVAWLMRRPLVLHEQNATVGMTNRILSHFATRVMEAFPGAFEEKVIAEYTGNPIRKVITDIESPATRFASRQGAIRILIIGGSLGAQALNETVPQAIALLPENMKVEVWHQSGASKLDMTRKAYESADVNAKVEEFIEDMADAYAWADLVICRAGALTVSEIAAAGVAAIFVPYPYAVDDHQTLNAQYLVDAGAAQIIQQKNMTVDVLTEVLTMMLEKGRTQLQTMAEAARKCAMPDATQRVAQACMEVING